MGKKTYSVLWKSSILHLQLWCHFLASQRSITDPFAFWYRLAPDTAVASRLWAESFSLQCTDILCMLTNTTLWVTIINQSCNFLNNFVSCVISVSLIKHWLIDSQRQLRGLMKICLRNNVCELMFHYWALIQDESLILDLKILTYVPPIIGKVITTFILTLTCYCTA